MFIATMAVGQVPDLAGAAYRQPLGNPRPRHCRLPAQARGEGDFLRVAFGTRSQFGCGPAGGVHPILPKPFGQVFIGFVALARLFVGLAEATKSFGEASGPNLPRPPASRAGGRPIGPGVTLASALFQSLLEMDALPGVVGPEAVRAPG